ncbi:MAG: MFS transporter, partial [Verrucomicrobiota bacterium]
MSLSLQLLRRGPFARYMAGEAISMLGTWMQMMAQGWVLAGLTTNAFTLGLVNFVSGVPML